MNEPGILIVEDENIVAEDLAVRIRGMGYRVVGIASHGQEAIEMADHLRPQLVLMDIKIKGPIDGIKTAEKIHEQQNLPVIFLTALSDPTTLARAKRTSPVGYLFKPFNEQDLATQVELALYKHNADQRLRESEERYRSLFQNNHAVMLLIDPRNGRIIDANPSACRYYGYSPDKIITLYVTDINTLAPEKLRQQIHSATSGEKRQFYFQHRLADGRIRDVEVFSGPIVIENRQLLYSIVHDITARRRAEEALKRMNETLEKQVADRTRLAETRAAHLQALAIELVRAEERERQRIAHLLHDDLQQVLAAAKLQFELVCERIPGEPLLEKAYRMIGEAIKKSRNLSHELNPTLMRASSLEAAMQLIAQRKMQQFGLDVELDICSTRAFDSEIMKVFVIRAVRELLFNIVKHAEVTQAKLTVSETNDCLVVRVSDNGRGFDPATLDAGDAMNGMGLLNLRQRACYIGGSLTIESAPGKGSRFELTIPFNLEPNADRQFSEWVHNVSSDIDPTTNKMEQSINPPA